MEDETVMPNAAMPLIVTIDDDPIILSTVLGILRPYYTVRPFSSGATALRFLSSNHADLIILDCNMPGIDGFGVMEILRMDAKASRIPLLFLTAMEDGDSEVLALKKGAGDYLLKPIKPQVLLTRIRLLLELDRYRNHMESLVEEKTTAFIQAYEQLQLREESVLSMLAKATDMRDNTTGDHIWRTTEFVRLISDELLSNPKDGYGLTQKQADNIIESSKLHDLGKIAVPDRILGKLGKLTKEEFDIIKLHPLQGAKFLDEFVDPLGDDSFLATARDIALYHHEKWDGTGYPFGISGAKAPLSSRIVALADVYDALISERPYKNAFSHEKSLSIIVSEKGRHFDPYLATCFQKCSESFRDVPWLLTQKKGGSRSAGVKNRMKVQPGTSLPET